MEPYLPLIRESIQTLYDNSIGKASCCWKCVSTDEQGKVKLFRQTAKASEGSFSSKSIIEIETNAQVVIQTFYDFERAKEFDEYFDSCNIVQNLLPPSSAPCEIIVTINEQQTPVKITRCDICHTKYHGIWPIFSARDAVHLLISGSIAIFDSSELIKSSSSCKFLCIASIDPERANALVPKAKSHVRMTLHIGGGIAVQNGSNPDSIILHQVNITSLGGWAPSKVINCMSSMDSQIKFKKTCEKRKN
jgi:hypothetical protein